ncbi:MAG: hypothetical protein FJZ64_04360 [Chlamydiae bacterium]|nr:hypothetical protein [Chlamydiota bacterium]
MKLFKPLVLAFLAFVMIFTACVTNYQKEGVFTNGYSDFKSDEDTFVVTFRATEETLPEKVLEHALLRSSELTLKHGFQYFSILETIKASPTIHYPSIRLKVQCYNTPPTDREWIDAKEFKALHFT